MALEDIIKTTVEELNATEETRQDYSVLGFDSFLARQVSGGDNLNPNTAFIDGDLQLSSLTTVIGKAESGQIFKVSTDGLQLGARDFDDSPFRVNLAGALTATSANITGTITGTAGTIGGWTINSTSIYTGTEDHSGYTANAGDMTLYSNGSDSSIHAKNFYIDTAGNLYCTSANVSGAVTTTAGSSLDGQYLTAASVASAAANLALRGWTLTCVFSVTDADTVAWTTGTFTASDGTAYSIAAGNTGNMSAKTYIYLDIATSTTALQVTTTAATAIGNGKVLIGVAENGTTEATFQIFCGTGGLNLDAANIVAGSITANEIAASTITAAKMNVSQLSAIAADLGTITAGSITINSGTASIDSSGNAVFKSVQVGGSTKQYSISDNGIFSFGDGSDGAATISSNTTLTVDKYYTDLTVDTGVTLNMGGYRIFATGTVTANGVISRNGNNGSNGTGGTNAADGDSPGTGGAGGAAGAALADGYLKGSLAGKAGGAGGTGGWGSAIVTERNGSSGSSGTTGSDTSNSIGSNGVAGATGGNGGDGYNTAGTKGTGGSGGGGGTATASNVKLIANWHLATLLDISSTGSTVKFDNSASCGSGGGGGGGAGAGVSGLDGAAGGGGGGGGGSGSDGGIGAIYAKTIVVSATGSITCNGGAGGNGGNGGNAAETGGSRGGGGGGGAGGGAGGNGGQLILVYNSLTNSGTISASGGAGGTGGTGGSGINGGTNGADGSSGTTGAAGNVRYFNISL